MLASILDQLGKNEQAIREANQHGLVVGLTLGLMLAVVLVAVVASRKK